MKEVHQKIADLIAANPSVANVLYHLGIHFDNYSEQTLSQICEQRGWKIDFVIRRLHEAINSNNQNRINLIDYPIDLIIEYLKHNHFIFIKEKLPYISSLIKTIDDQSPEIAKEIKFVYPLFLQEFIEHIYEEEDTVFAYILQMYHYLYQDIDMNDLVQKLNKYSIADFAAEHHQDDGLNGIRTLTNHFQVQENDHLKTKVLIQALREFNEEMKIHARIENEILFPKALQLEKAIRTVVMENQT